MAKSQIPESEPNQKTSSGQQVPVALPTASRAAERSEGRVRLLLDVGLFQFKLLADGLRDILLVPLSLAAAAYGILFGGDEPARPFQSLLRQGHRSDRFINLFNQHTSVAAQDAGDPAPDPVTSDELLAPYRDRLVAQAQSSKLTAKASQLVDDLSDRRADGSSPERPDSH